MFLSGLLAVWKNLVVLGPLEKFADVGSLQKAIWCEKEVFWPSGNTADVSKHVRLQWDVLEILVKLGHQLQV